MKPRLAAIAVALCACSAPRSLVTGAWKGEVTMPSGETEDIAFAFEGRGDTLTGTIVGAPPGTTRPIENGRIAQDDVSFAIRVERPEGPAAVFTFAGKVAGDRMQGSVSGEDAARRFTFTASRTSADPHALARAAGGGRRTAHAAAGSGPPKPQGTQPTPRDASQAVLAAFDTYEVVGLGILSYANQDFDQFIFDLVRNPNFPSRVNDIVVECGNALYQPLLDRYIAGDSVAAAEARRVWRNTTQPFCGVSGFYEQLYPLVRRINETLPAGRKLRMLGGDPPVDWSAVRTQAELRPFENRDSSIAAVMEREVLAKHRKALMIFGVRHLMHGGGGAVARYERAGYAGRTFVVMAHNGFGADSPLSRYNDTLEGRLAGWPVPSLVPLRGTWLDDLPWPYFIPDVDRETPVSASVDGYLYLGPGNLLLNQPIPARAVLDTAYMAELRRRLQRSPRGPDVVMDEARTSGVFFNEPGRR